MSKDMERKIELLSSISYHMCPECGSDRDCGLEYDECSRIRSAIEVLDKWIELHCERRENGRENDK